jgi:hypothetical protein
MVCWKKYGPAAHMMICDVVWESMDMAGEASVALYEMDTRKYEFLYEQHELDPREVHWFPFVFYSPRTPFRGYIVTVGSKDICFWSIYLRLAIFTSQKAFMEFFFFFLPIIIV